MLAFGQAGCGAGGCHCGIDDLGVSQGCYNFLCNQNLATDRAMLAFGQTSFGTGRSNCGINNLGVSQGRNLFLCNQNLAADGTVLAFGQTSCGTGRCNCGIDDLSMAQSIHISIHKTVAAAYTGVGSVAAFGTGGSGHYGIIVMAQGFYFTALRMIATGAFALFLTLLAAGRCLGLRPGAHVMTQSFHFICHIAVTAESAGMGGIPVFHASGQCHFGLIIMSSIQNKQFITIVARPHNHIDSHCTLRGGQVAIGVELGIGFIGTHGSQYTQFIKPSQANTVDSSAVETGFLEGGSPEPVTGPDRKRHRVNTSGGMNTPAIHCVILPVMLQQIPQVGAGANILRQRLQVILINRLNTSLGDNDEISGNCRNGNHAVSIHGGSDILTAHGDCDRQILTANLGNKRLSAGYALVIAERAFRSG